MRQQTTAFCINRTQVTPDMSNTLGTFEFFTVHLRITISLRQTSPEYRVRSFKHAINKPIYIIQGGTATQ